MIVTRFPPSPTGYLHIGGLRTALYNYLFAKQQGGKMILRIEDTDRNRLVEGAAEKMVQTLERMGIHIDEGPIFQSDRHEAGIYKKAVDQLLEAGHAYRCFCTKERLDEMRKQQQAQKETPRYDRHCLGLSEEEIKQQLDAGTPFVVRMKIPEGETTFADIIRGSITINHKEIDDQVILKSDGWPTYHLAVVVDDHDMGVTHVIRGEEWLSSVPKHVLLYQYFGWNLPTFAHVPLILNPDKSKLSKRQGDVAVEDYLEKGYLVPALNNFVTLLGFNPKGDQEIYSVDELINLFDLSKVNKSGAVFDREKLDWMNGQYISALSAEALLELVKDRVDCDESVLLRVLEVEKTRMKRLTDIEELVKPYQQLPDYEAELLVWKKADATDAKEQLAAVKTFIESLDVSSITLIEEGIRGYITDTERSNGNVLWPLRVALSGSAKSASPFELLWVLGREEGMRRIDHALTLLGG